MTDHVILFHYWKGPLLLRLNEHEHEHERERERERDRYIDYTWLFFTMVYGTLYCTRPRPDIMEKRFQYICQIIYTEYKTLGPSVRLLD